MGNLLAWWQEKMARAAQDKKETVGYDNLSTIAGDILGAFVTTDLWATRSRPWVIFPKVGKPCRHIISRSIRPRESMPMRSAMLTTRSKHYFSIGMA